MIISTKLRKYIFIFRVPVMRFERCAPTLWPVFTMVWRLAWDHSRSTQVRSYNHAFLCIREKNNHLRDWHIIKRVLIIYTPTFLLAMLEPNWWLIKSFAALWVISFWILVYPSRHLYFFLWKQMYQKILHWFKRIMNPYYTGWKHQTFCLGAFCWIGHQRGVTLAHINLLVRSSWQDNIVCIAH